MEAYMRIITGAAAELAAGGPVTTRMPAL